MTPSEFADLVVSPTVRDFLAHRGDRRRAYLACITTYSLVEYVGHAEGTKNIVRDTLRSRCGEAYAIVQGIANGTKHAGSSSGGFRFSPGDETPAPTSIIDPNQSYKLGQRLRAASSFDFSKPHLVVLHHEILWTLDLCVQICVMGVIISYPKWLDVHPTDYLDAEFADKIDRARDGTG